MKYYSFGSRLAQLLAFLLIMQLIPLLTAAQGRGQSVSSVRNKRWALVIGNGAYTDSPLANPPNDARDMARSLRDLGFSVTELINQSRKDMRTAIRSFGENLRSGGVGLFYYAGHGIQVNGKNYLIPVGADVAIEQEIEDEAIDVGLVLKHMAEAGNRPNIVILDACRNNPFARSFRSSSRGLAFMDAPSGMIIAYATAPGTVANDGKERNGVYTAELLKQIHLPGLKVEDVFKRTRAAVERQTNKTQVPWESVSITEDFYFVVGSDQPDLAGSSPVQRQRPRPEIPDKDTAKPQTSPITRQQPKKQSVESNFFRFDLQSCKVSGAKIICDLTITNTDSMDKKLMLRPGWDSDGTRAWDNFGNLYNADYPQLANSTTSEAVIPVGTSPKARITLKRKGQADSDATKLTKLELVCNSGGIFRVTFRDICLVDECENR